jgi:hypothetical protein
VVVADEAGLPAEEVLERLLAALSVEHVGTGARERRRGRSPATGGRDV